MSNPSTCDPGRIELFLEQKLSDEEQSAFESHLSACDNCRHRLEAAAAGEDISFEICESLRGDCPDFCPSKNGTVPFDAAADSAAGEDASSCHATVLKLLGPTDDDRMLGRWGTYEVVGVVGAGGMGVVLKALDVALNRYVAIKILAPHLGTSGAAIRRFSREGKAAAAVVHDNVIEIYGVAEAAGLPYLVMPYVRGPSLQRRLDDEGPLAVVEVLRVAMQAAAGLAAAHAQGLVHRDVKPANILLADGIERVKLTDFGLARAADDASLTRTGVIAGTPQYMSPEQARGELVDPRSDLFSLGSVLYAMCTGRPPFRAETSYGVLRRITDEEPRPIREINPDVPDWLCDIVAKLMAKQPDDRFQSASEVALLLEQCLAHVQQPTVVPLPDILITLRREENITTERDEYSPANPNPTRQRGNLRAFIATAIGLLFFGGVALAFGILIHLKKDNKTTTIEVPEGSTAHVDSKGDVTLELASSAVVTEGKTSRVSISDLLTIHPLDVLQIRAAEALPGEPIDGYYGVEPDGNVAIGPTYGRVNLGGLSVEQAEERIVEKLKAFLKSPMVQVIISRTNPPWHVATVPRQPYTIQPFDLLQINVTGPPADNPIDNYFMVEAEGTVPLGPGYGRVRLKGLTLEEAEKAIAMKLRDVLRDPKVWVTLAGREGPGAPPKAPYTIKPNDLLYIVAAWVPEDEPISGVYAVEPRGTVLLGRSYGRVNVQGLSLEAAEKVIQKKLQQFAKAPEVSVTLAGWAEPGSVFGPGSTAAYLPSRGDTAGTGRVPYPILAPARPPGATALPSPAVPLYPAAPSSTLPPGATAIQPNPPAMSQNILKNSGVEVGDKTPDNWQQGAAIEGVTYSWCKTAAFEGKASLCIEKTADRYFPIAQWSQTVDRQGDRPAVFVSAQVKAEKMTKAVLDVSFLDARGEWLSHQWANQIGSQGPGKLPANHDWRQYSGAVTIPPQAKKLCIGLQVYGPGKVWFDDIRAEYVGEIVAQQDDSKAGKTAERIATLEALVDAVVENYNLGFAKLGDIYDAQDKLLNAQLEAEKSKAERVAIWEKLLKSRQEMEKRAEANAKARVEEGTKADLLCARAARQKAELGLAEEKARREVSPQEKTLEDVRAPEQSGGSYQSWPSAPAPAAYEEDVSLPVYRLLAEEDVRVELGVTCEQTKKLKQIAAIFETKRELDHKERKLAGKTSPIETEKSLEPIVQSARSRVEQVLTPAQLATYKAALFTRSVWDILDDPKARHDLTLTADQEIARVRFDVDKRETIRRLIPDATAKTLGLLTPAQTAQLKEFLKKDFDNKDFGIRAFSLLLSTATEQTCDTVRERLKLSPQQIKDIQEIRKEILAEANEKIGALSKRMVNMLSTVQQQRLRELIQRRDTIGVDEEFPRAVHAGAAPVTGVSTPPAPDAHTDNPLIVDARRNKQRYVATMRMLEAKLRANYEQIKTWSGTYELKEGSKDRGNNSWVERKVLVQYAIDMRHNRLFTTYERAGTETVTNLETKKVRQVHVPFPFRERYVLTGEHWLKSTPAPEKNETENQTGPRLSRGKGVNSAYRKKRDEANEYMDYSSVVDPRRFYCESRIPFWDCLRMDSEWLEAGKPLPMKIGETRSKSGVNYSLIEEFRPSGPEGKEKPTVGVSLFDSAAGYQVTSERLTRPDGKTESESEWKYTRVSGIYIPQRYHLRKYFESGELELEREFTSVDAKLNEPIAEDRFGWHALGLREGDQILDEIDSATFRYHDGKPIPAAQYVDESVK